MEGAYWIIGEIAYIGMGERQHCIGALPLGDGSSPGGRT